MAELMLSAKMNYNFFVFCSEYVSPGFTVDNKISFRLHRQTDYILEIYLWQQIAAGSRVFSFCRTLQLLLRRILPYPHRRIGRCSF